MLIGMTERGPESAGLAVFTEAVGRRASQVQRVLRERDRTTGRLSTQAAMRDWARTRRVSVQANHAVLETAAVRRRR